ncbi:MAG: transporter substrate-binding domain-containing protein [Candidatus Nanoarchaeia archaeon]|jgi:ABC-type amino acid transport substrate-binding protein|nr:transporter substrate-binding domain-containing protein [Candidatus Nanoarchaeia archaeon]
MKGIETSMKSFVVLFILLVSFSVSSDTLKVAVYDFPPCVILEQGKNPTGFDVEVFEEIAKRAKLDIKYEIPATFSELLDGMQNGIYDAAISGITITGEREAKFDFSHPYLNSGLSICVNKDKEVNILNVLILYFKQMGTPFKIFGVFLLLGIIGIWVVERGRLFHKNPIKGAGDGLYWIITTITTVGYGDKTPQTPIGKFITIIVMLVGIGFIFPYIIASMNTALTTEKTESAINSVQDLIEKKVATEKGTTAEAYVKGMSCIGTYTEKIEDAYDLLANNKVDAVIFDMPTLKYYVSNAGKKRCKIAGEMFDKQSYGFALKQDSPYRESLNEHLVDFMRTDLYWRLYARWFGE